MKAIVSFSIIVVVLTFLSVTETTQGTFKKVPLDDGIKTNDKPRYSEEYYLKLKKKASEFRKSLSEGITGRFQVSSGEHCIILDTKEGHIWAQAGLKTYYCGFVYPGIDVGDIINERPIKSLLHKK